MQLPPTLHYAQHRPWYRRKHYLLIVVLFAAIAAGFDTAVSTWLALLITAGILLLLAGILGVLAAGRFQKGTPPVPEQAIREAKLTADALKSDGTGA